VNVFTTTSLNRAWRIKCTHQHFDCKYIHVWGTVIRLDYNIFYLNDIHVVLHFTWYQKPNVTYGHRCKVPSEGADDVHLPVTSTCRLLERADVFHLALEGRLPCVQFQHLPHTVQTIKNNIGVNDNELGVFNFEEQWFANDWRPILWYCVRRPFSILTKTGWRVTFMPLIISVMSLERASTCSMISLSLTRRRRAIHTWRYMKAAITNAQARDAGPTVYHSKHIVPVTLNGTDHRNQIHL